MVKMPIIDDNTDKDLDASLPMTGSEASSSQAGCSGFSVSGSSPLHLPLDETNNLASSQVTAPNKRVAHENAIISLSRQEMGKGKWATSFTSLVIHLLEKLPLEVQRDATQEITNYLNNLIEEQRKK